MKEYGPSGHGASFSMSSNLSPLAPPFTVDPTFLGPVHDLPLGNRPESRHEPYFEDDPHYAFPARPSHDNWLQLNSHAYEPSLFPNPNPGPVTSPPTSKTSIDPATAYGQSMNNFFGSPSESWPYHPLYPPASFEGCNTNTSFDVNGRGNVLPASVLPPTAPSSVFWNAKSDSEPWKEKGKDVNVAAPSYASIVNRGISSTDGLSARPEPPRVWFGKSAGLESKVVNSFFGSREINLPNGKISTSEENSKDIPYDMSRVSSASFQEKPYNLTPPPDFAMESWTQLTPSIPYGRYFTGGDSYKGDPLCFYPVSSNPSLDQIYGSSSISGKTANLTSKSLSTSTSPIELPRDAWQRKDGFTRDSPSGMGCTPVMDEISKCYGGADSINNGVAEYVERHAIGGKSTMLTSRSVSSSTSPIERPRDAWQRKEVYAGVSPSNSRSTPVMAEISGCYGGKRSSNIGAEEYVDPLMSEDVPLLHSPPPSTGPLRHLFKAENKVQVTDFGLPGTLLTAETGVCDSVECSSEVLEHFNPGVDSPCWKGASDSRYSLFGASDTGTADMPAKILGGCSTRSIQGPQELPVHFNKAVAFPTELQRNEKCYREDSSSSLLEQAFPVATLPSLEHHSNLPKIGPDHSQFSNTNVIHFPFPGNTGGGSDVESLRTNISCYDEYTVGSRQAVKIADPGIDNLTEPILQPSTSTKFPIGDVGKVANMMQTLSELFLSYCCTVGVALEEQDHVVIEQVIQNLETSLKSVGTTRSSPKTQLPQCEMYKCSEKPTDAHKGTAAGGSQATNYSLVTEAGMFQTTCTEVKDVGSRQYIQNACKGSNSSNMDNSRPLSFPSGDSEMEQDEMTKAIKIILEENFSDEEEQEPQNMLYKNLWLEAEAALCSINYKARFARMRGEMKYKKHQTKGELIDVEKLPSSSGPIEIKSVNCVEPKSKESGDSEVANVLMQDHNKSTAASHLENIVDSRSKETEDGHVANVLMQDQNESTSAGIPEDTVESMSKETKDGEVAAVLMPDHSECSTESRTENLEASVMARFHILKSRISSKVPINNDGQQDDSGSGSLHTGTQEASSNPGNMQCAEDIVMKPQPPKVVNPNFSALRNPLHFMSENSEVDLHYMDHYSSRYPSAFIKLCSQPTITAQMDHFSGNHVEEKLGFHELHDLLEFSAMQSANTNSPVDQYCAGDYDSHSPSSDWEHVLKEATWPA